MKVSKFGWLAALLAVAAVVGAVGFTPRTADAAVTAAAKTCGPTGTENQGICNLVINESNLAAGNVYTITIGGPGRFLQQLNPVLPAATTSDADCVATVTSFSATQIVVTISGPAACGPGAGTVTVQELVGLTGSGTVSQTVVGSGGTSGTTTVNATGLPAFTANVVQSVVKECNIPAIPGRPAGTVLVNQPVDCTLSITFNEAPTAPVPGTVTVTNGTFQGPGGQTGTSFSFTCAAGSAFCGITETVVPTTAGSVPTQNVAIGGSNFGNLTGGITAVLAANQGFVQGQNFIIRCPTALNPGLAGIPQLTPGQIGGAGTAIAVGVLPAALICEAVFTTTTGGTTTDLAVAPGTIEVTALSGSLVDLAGRLTTNLRIGCGSTQSTAVVNDCNGVRFGVLGIGVGFVELRARYEPSTAAAQAGIQEREATATVGFIAPAVRLDLALSPNPVAVGATGTATLRFNRLFFFPGTDVLFIDPTTGAPIAFNFGSPLNGTARFVTENPAIAALTPAQTTTTGSPIATSSEAFVRCGGQTAVVTGGVLSDFFGGCDQVQVGYRGVAPGSTVISATFIPDLPNAFGTTVAGTTSLPTSSIAGLTNLATGIASNTVSRNLEVQGVGPATTQRLVVGCNNVVAPANETVQQVAARVDPASAAVSIWKQVPGTTQFQGAPVGGNVPSGVANLSNVNALDAIFICVSAAATYRLT